MKKFLFPASAILMLTACSSHDYAESPDDPQDIETIGKITLHIVSGDMTRASETLGDDVKTVHVAYYNGDDLIEVMEATADEDGNFTSDVPGSSKNRPDKIITYVNLPDEYVSAIEVSLTGALSLEIPELYTTIDDTDLHIMTTAAHYEEIDDVETLVYYQPISTEDYAGEGKTINIYVERLAAKVTASLAKTTDFSKLTAICNYYSTSNISKKDYDLEIDGWEVTATKTSTFLVKNFDASEFNTSPSWLEGNNNIHWANSVSYSTDLAIPELNNGTSENQTLNYVTAENISNSFSGYGYYHESTRPYADYDKDNHLASIILKGHYGDMKTDIIKYVDTYYTSEGFFEMLEKDQKIIFAQNYTGFSSTNLQKYLKFESTGNGGEANLVADESIIGNAYDSDHTKYTSVDEINKLIQGQYPTVEYFKSGQCFFIIPIQNSGYVANASEQTLGAYGLVRNHHYNITVSGISGIGQAIADESALALTSDFVASEKAYTVSYGLTVLDWSNVTQEIK